MNFSILISIYKNDTAQDLNQALCSIATNTTIPSQIILVEDGKLTPELYSILDYWEKKLSGVLQRIPLPNNIGLGRALNAGLKYCHHDWVFRMDTDDICVKDRFAQQIEFIKENPDIDVFSGYIEEFSDSPENPIGIKKVPLIHEEIMQYARWRCPFNHVAIAYKKSVIESVGGYQHHLLMEDYNLWLRVLAAGYKGSNIANTLVYVRAGSSMVMRRRGWKYVKSEWKLFKLKRKLHFQPFFPALICFLLRSLPRVLPNSILAFMYRLIRY